MAAGNRSDLAAAEADDKSGADSLANPEAYARSYQLEALEKAKQQNTIVFLETGSGKTLIAVMLLRSYAYALRKPSRHIAVFLVPTVVLVNQQARVIAMHTDLKVGMFFGEMGVDFWNASTWKEKLDEFEVFVMTPQILLDNLRHTFFKLSDIKLLIFDECHNARGRSPYACIMTEFYHRLLGSSYELPRIFGMTASLVNSKGSNSQIVYGKQILELENLLNSKVYTVWSESVLSPYISFPTPKIKLYQHLEFQPQLFLSLTNHLRTLKTKHLGALDDTFDPATKERLTRKISLVHATFTFCLTELGAWLTVKAAESLTCKKNYLFFWGESKDWIGDNAVKLFIQDVFQVLSLCLPKERCIGDDIKADVDAGLLTTKVHCLVESLLEYRDLDGLKCIIFVERVITAIVIQSLLGNIKCLSGLGTKYMAGYNSIMHSQSRNEQMKIIDAFHQGEVNVIIATQILEEGLDVRGCNLVIRFDLSTSLCSFIQSRGRARMKGSDYLLLVQRSRIVKAVDYRNEWSKFPDFLLSLPTPIYQVFGGDSAALSKVENFLKSGDMMREESIKRASIPCRSPHANVLEDEMFCVEATGAIVTLNSSVALIYFYCSRLPSDEYFKPSPRFVFEIESNKAILYLPKSSPIQVVQSECTINVTKEVLCLEACKKLHEAGALNDYLLPASEFEIEEETQQTVFDPYKNEQHDYFPGELVDSWFSFCCLGLYHCYKITIGQDFTYDCMFNDIMLVVKSNLGNDFHSYSFNLEAERGPVSVHIGYVGPVYLSRQQVTMAKLFQISMFNLLLHCDYTMLMDTLHCLHKKQSCLAITYLLVPLAGGKFDWHCVKSFPFQMSSIKGFGRSCASNGLSCLVRTLNGPVCCCTFQNCVVYTPHNGKLYFVYGILPDMNANSTFKLKDGQVIPYKEYYRSRHGITLAYEHEPLLSARHLFKVQNYLLRRSFREENACSLARVQLVPELCSIIMSPISVNTLYSFSFVPSIMHRIQCLLLAARLNQNILANSMQNFDVSVLKVLEAITTKKCQEEFSLETLETLGDSFLKYATSRHLYMTYKHHHEGILSAKKDKLVSNAALCRLGCHRNFAGFIRTKQFNPAEWFIPGNYVEHFEEKTVFPSLSAYSSGTRHMKSKVIADSIEAMIGLYLSYAGEMAALNFIEWLGIKMEFHEEMIIERNALSNPGMYVNVKDLQLLLNYSFKNTSVLLEALTHGSYQIADVPGCYQRLEFLGDALLDFLMTWYLFKKYPGLTPGLLTDLRSASVNNNYYARAAVKASLNKHILHASTELHKKITFYLEYCAQDSLDSSYGLDASTQPPKVLGDIIESIAGAIFVDSGYNKETVWDCMRPLLEPIATPETVERHPVSELEDICARKAYKKSFMKSCHDHVLSMTAEVEVKGTVYTATVTGPNKKTTKRMAAKAVLKEMKSKGVKL